MAQKIKIEGLGDAIEQVLTDYHARVVMRANNAGAKAIKALVQRTKAAAPKRSGKFARSITSDTIEARTGSKMMTYVWHVKPPHYRRTHLLEHGHAKRNGGRVSGAHFLETALGQVLPGYEKGIEEALKDD